MVTTKANKSTKRDEQNISYLDWAFPKINKLNSGNCVEV